MSHNENEDAIKNLNELWIKLKDLMEGNADTKYQGILPNFLKGRAVTQEQYTLFLNITRDIGFDIGGLVRNAKLSPAEQKAHDEAVAERQCRYEEQCAKHKSPIQEFVDDAMADYIKDNDLDPALLTGPSKEVMFKYYETVRDHRSDSNLVKLPAALMEHFDENGDIDERLPEWLVNRMNEHGDTYELFSDTESYDGETVDSNIEFEERR